MSSLLRINVFKVDVPREGERGWKRTSAEVTSNELGEDLLKEVSKGAVLIMCIARPGCH